MKRRSWTFELAPLRNALLAAFFLCRIASTEPPNPFGSEGAPPPPPPPPVDGSDLGAPPPSDDPSGGDPGFGFGSPTDAPPPPPPIDDGISASDSFGAPSSPPPSSISSSGSRGGTPGPSGSLPPSPVQRLKNKKNAKAGGTKGNGKETAPKLADYLELDPSLRSLEVKNFDLPDKDIKDVVTLISKWTGKNFILDNKVRGKITIMGPSQVTLQEAYQAFLSALEANSLTTIQSGKFIRIIESAEARRAPVETYAGEYAPDTDQFITRIFQLRFINADEVQREFRDMTSRQGKLFAYEPTNSIIITDTGSNIKRIEGILRTLDVKNYETTLHVLKIRNSSAKSISDMLGEIYGEGKNSRTGTSGANPRVFRRNAMDRLRGGGVISKVIPDESTNSLIVLANAAGFRQLVALVAKLDVKVTDTGKIHVYYCEHQKAEDLAATLASLSGGGSSKSSSGRKMALQPNAAAGGQQAAAPAGGPVTAELEGGVKITSDAATNSLVITANASDYQTLKRVIRKLDIPRLQVFVETAILEVALDTQTKVGLNAAISSPNIGPSGGFIGDASTLTSILSKTGVPEGATLPIFAGPTVTSSINSAAGSTSFSIPTFTGLLNLLTKTTNTSVLSTPQIIALDNEKAEFKVLDETPVQSTFNASAGGAINTGGFATGNIERQKTGIEIKLTPHVNAASRTVRLELEQKVDSLKATTDVPEALQKVNRATTSRVTNTSVVVRDQDFIMLGGLMSDKVDDSVSKLPLLGDVPIIGWLFKSKSYKVVKTNLIILLRPRIVGTTIESAALVDESLDKRQQFVDENFAGDDQFEREVGDLRERLMRQRERGRNQIPYKYNNNSDDDTIDEPPTTSQREESPFDGSGANGQRNRNLASPQANQIAAPPPPRQANLRNGGIGAALATPEPKTKSGRGRSTPPPSEDRLPEPDFGSDDSEE